MWCLPRVRPGLYFFILLVTASLFSARAFGELVPLPGWPQVLPPSPDGTHVAQGPVYVDFRDGQGQQTVVALGSKVYLLKSNGVPSVAPLDADPGHLYSGSISSYAVGDLDNDGTPESIAAVYDRGDSSELFVWNAQGTLRFRAEDAGEYVAIENIQGNGNVVITAGSKDIILYSASGQRIYDWQPAYYGVQLAPLAFVDLGNGTKGVVAVQEFIALEPPGPPDGIHLIVYGPNGATLPGFPVFLYDGVWLPRPGAPLVVNGTGMVGNGPTIFAPVGSVVHAFDLAGAPLPGWPVTESWVVSGIAPSDIDRDGTLELVIRTTGQIDVRRQQGGHHWLPRLGLPFYRRRLWHPDRGKRER